MEAGSSADRLSVLVGTNPNECTRTEDVCKRRTGELAAFEAYDVEYDGVVNKGLPGDDEDKNDSDNEDDSEA